MPVFAAPRPARAARTLLFVLALGAVWLGAGDALAAGPRHVRVELGPEMTMQTLVAEGFDVLRPGPAGTCELLEWPGDAERFAALGLRVSVLDPDPGATAAARTAAELGTRPRPAGRPVWSNARGDGRYRIEVLPPFGSGGFAGYYTLAEVKVWLDDLVAGDTQDVVADAVDSIGATHQGRPIWGLEIGKAWPGPDPDPRRVVYLNSLTHAREPEGMQSLVYFVNDILSKYGSDPVATYLLNHRRIYLCPVVNPDGYLWNQNYWSTNGSFSYWRKNARDNNLNSVFDAAPGGTAADGVDLNRNFPYQWGYPNGGSSSTPSSIVYRGPSAASEPETQTQMARVIALQPASGLSYHTHSDLLLHPWGWTEAATLDSARFERWSDDMTAGNGYQSGQGTRVLYAVNGEFNDWCYGDTLAKPRAFTWTPEVGKADDGFWPPPSRIVPLAEENLRHAWYVTAIAGPHVRAEAVEMLPGFLNAGHSARLRVDATNVGLATTGPGLVGALTPLSAGATVPAPTMAYGELPPSAVGGPLIPQNQWFEIAVDDTVTPGRVLVFQVDFSTADGTLSRDTVEVVCGTSTRPLFENVEGSLAAWSTGSFWGVETDGVNHWFSDTPSSIYPSLMDNVLTLTTPLDLTAGTMAWLSFRARWDYETTFDGAVVEATLDGSVWIRLPIESVPFSHNQTGSVLPPGERAIQGTSHRWRRDRASLAGFTGPGAGTVRVRFRSLSDNGLSFDGLHLDDIEVALYDPAYQPSPTAVELGTNAELSLGAPRPNPARATTTIEFALPGRERVRLEILDVQGRHVRTLADGLFDAGRWAHGWDLRDDAGAPAPAGLYFVRLATAGGTRVRRVAALR